MDAIPLAGERGVILKGNGNNGNLQFISFEYGKNLPMIRPGLLLVVYDADFARTGIGTVNNARGPTINGVTLPGAGSRHGIVERAQNPTGRTTPPDNISNTGSNSLSNSEINAHINNELNQRIDPVTGRAQPDFVTKVDGRAVEVYILNEAFRGITQKGHAGRTANPCLLYTSPSPRD